MNNLMTDMLMAGFTLSEAQKLLSNNIITQKKDWENMHIQQCILEIRKSPLYKQQFDEVIKIYYDIMHHYEPKHLHLFLYKTATEAIKSNNYSIQEIRELLNLCMHKIYDTNVEAGLVLQGIRRKLSVDKISMCVGKKDDDKESSGRINYSIFDGFANGLSIEQVSLYSNEAHEMKRQELKQWAFENHANKITTDDCLFFTRGEWDVHELKSIRKALVAQVPRDRIIKYIKPGEYSNPQQIDEIVEGLIAKLPDEAMQLFAKNDFDASQMAEIRKGFLDNLSYEQVSLYATTDFIDKQMREIRNGLVAGIDVSVYANKHLSYEIMRVIREEMCKHTQISHQDIKRLTTITNLPSTLEALFKIMNKYKISLSDIEKYLYQNKSNGYYEIQLLQIGAELFNNKQVSPELIAKVVKNKTLPFNIQVLLLQSYEQCPEKANLLYETYMNICKNYPQTQEHIYKYITVCLLQEVPPAEIYKDFAIFRQLTSPDELHKYLSTKQSQSVSFNINIHPDDEISDKKSPSCK